MHRIICASALVLAFVTTACASRDQNPTGLGTADPALSNSTCTTKRGIALYRAEGLIETWNVDSNGLMTYVGAANVAPGYTHMVGLGGTREVTLEYGTLFLYNRSNGNGEVGLVTSTGQYSRQHSWTGGFGQWDKIVQLGRDGLTFFYNSNGAGALVEFKAPYSTSRTVRLWQPGDYGAWTSIAQGLEGPNSIAFYRKDVGQLVVGKFGPAPNYALAQRADAIASGWTHLASDGRRLLFHNEVTGAAQTGVADLNIVYRPYRTTTLATVGYGQLIARENGVHVFGAPASGSLKTAREDLDAGPLVMGGPATPSPSPNWTLLSSAGDFDFCP